MTQKLKPFNLELALAGDPVVTFGLPNELGGTDKKRKVKEIKYFKYYSGNYPLQVIFEDELDRYYCYSITGKSVPGSEFLCAADLFMAPKTKKLWIGISRKVTSREHDFYVTSNAFLSASDLVKYTEECSHVVQIEIEE